MAAVEAEMVSGIPVVDFTAFSLKHITRPSASSEEVQILARKIYNAFSTVGFVYLVNHGISESEIDNIFGVMHQFFNLEKETKKSYNKWDDALQNGWDRLEKERQRNYSIHSNNPDRPPDLKESFDIGHIHENSFKWPDDVSPDFKPRIQSFYENLKILGLRILSAIALGLDLDVDTFAPSYQKMGTKNGNTQLRLNYYPKLNQDFKFKQDQIRCGEHTDYGGVSILFQDDCGGLEVQNVDGEYVQVTPIKGAAIVNIADLMQRWTADKLKSTYHRVSVTESLKERARCSAVFFFNPDRDAIIQCLDGQNKYPTVKAGDYIHTRLQAGYSAGT